MGKIFYKRFFSQQFKRSCLPDGPKIGSVALSPRSDFRMPSDASVNVWLSELEILINTVITVLIIHKWRTKYELQRKLY